MPLQISHTNAGARVILAVAGDLDLVTGPDLTGDAMSLIDAGTRDIIIDATSISFCDSSGLTAFVRIANRLGPDGGRLAVAAPSANVRRILEITGLTETIVVADSVADAAAELDTAR